MAAFPPRVLRHIVDVHCHPTDSPISAKSMEQLEISVCAMSTHHGDQSMVRDLALQNPAKVIPCFGYHPWFTHRISLRPVTSKSEHYRRLFLGDDAQPSAESASVFEELLPLLPEPITLEEVISDLRRNFELFSSTTAMLGEVGLDKPYRVAFDYYASPRRLTPFTIPLDHQLSILEAQIDLAVELRRNVSFHSVKCPQVTVDLLNKLKQKHGPQWDNIRVDIHSCSMNPQVMVDLQKKHHNVFMSLSTTINGRSNNLNALVAACPPDRLLIESDFNTIEGCTERCVEILNLVARIKRWPIEEEWADELDKGEWGVVRRIEANWKAFISGEILQEH
ncbi:Dnase family scn1 [Mycena venus]|uniref:Dnase family scn1 n=1 Tax=Mycena venus TaxID=2733690 RepID=A0A8H7CRK4_9AGAR|nr:Dnase family scn1 [Mycena venus]